MALLDTAAVVYQVVLTKGDKAKRNAPLAQVRDEIVKKPAAHPDILVTSSRDKTGIAELRAAAAALADWS